MPQIFLIIFTYDRQKKDNLPQNDQIRAVRVGNRLQIKYTTADVKQRPL